MEKTKDELVEEMFQRLEKVKDQINQAEKPVWHTNCVFEMNSNRINIKTLGQVRDVLVLANHITGLKTNWDLVNKLLGTNEKFEYSSFSYDEWISDFKTRINQINITEKRKTMQQIQDGLDKLISKEKREQMELQRLNTLLNNL